MQISLTTLSLGKLRQRACTTYPRSWKSSVGSQACETPKPTLYIEEEAPGTSIPLPFSLVLPVSPKIPFSKLFSGMSLMIYLSPSSLIYGVLVIHRGT